MAILTALALLLAAGGWKAGHPAPPPVTETLAGGAAATELRAQYFGTTTLLFRDGRNAVMVDALLSRPGLWTVLTGKLASDRPLVARILDQAGVSTVDLLLISHSHYDHVLDAPEVARLTGATMMGSSSTREVALGSGLPESAIHVLRDGETLSVGAFHIRVLHSLHSPDDQVPGVIERPVRPPAPASDYKEGGSFAFLIEHGDRRIIVHASSNYVPGMYRGLKADTVFLATGGLGRQSDDFARRYWDEVVTQTGAKLVVPIHWDDFLRPLDQPLLPMRRFMDDFDKAMARVRPLAARDGVAIRYMPVITPVSMERLPP